MTPFWDFNFTPRVVIWQPHISSPTGSLDLISICALRYRSQILPPILCAIGLALAGQATRGNDANCGDFGIMTPLDEPVVPWCWDLRGNQVG